MNKLYYFLFFFISFQTAAQDSLAKYTPEKLGYKSSMATRLTDKPLLWKVYFDGMMRKKPTDSLLSDTYYNLSWDLYRYTDYDLDFVMGMMKKAIYHGKKAHDNRGLIYAFDSLGAFYAMKNDHKNALECIEEIKKIHKPDSVDAISYLEYSADKIYIYIGDFQRATSLLLKANKDIDAYVLQHPELSKDILTGFVYDKKVNYIQLVQCYNFQKKLDSSAFYIKKIREIERKGYPFHNNFDWIEEAFYLVLSKKYDLAIQYIDKSEKKCFIDTKDKHYRANYYLALCWAYKKDYHKSLQLCEQALQIHTKFFSFINYELELYKLAASNAAKLGDSKKEIYYSKKYNETSQKMDYLSKSKFVAQLYELDVQDAKEKLELEKTKMNYAYYITGVILLFLCCIIVYYLKLKKDRKKFKDIIWTLENNQSDHLIRKNNTPSEEPKPISSETINRKPLKISTEVEEKILGQLKTFERKERYLSSIISLSNMANDFKINSAYLSTVIKKNKHNNFNGYINDLRIEYITKKLKTSPEYLNYKISYLAEECGFSSHTVFIRIFTEKTGVTPSKFISFLKVQTADN